MLIDDIICGVNVSESTLPCPFVGVSLESTFPLGGGSGQSDIWIESRSDGLSEIGRSPLLEGLSLVLLLERGREDMVEEEQ